MINRLITEITKYWLVTEKEGKSPNLFSEQNNLKQINKQNSKHKKLEAQRELDTNCTYTCSCKVFKENTSK